jgi:DNA polymerase/3'-5' exonuclease PolX
MIYAQAKAIADGMVERLSGYCDRIEVAGSVRRKKPEVHDIEIVAIPKAIDEPNMFDAVGKREFPSDLFLPYRMIKNGSRYKQMELPEGINLDLFIVLPPAQLGVILTIRTGPADFSHKIVTSKSFGGYLPGDCKVHDGGVYRGGELIPMPEETDFLDFVGLGWIEPEKRS